MTDTLTTGPADGVAPAASAPAPTRGETWGLSRQGVATVTRLELRQRVRSTRWIVSLVVFGVVVGVVTTLTWAVSRQPGITGPDVGPAMFGFIVFFVLFLGLLVSPTLSATSINGDRAAGTLATLQVTLLTPAEIVVGKLLAAWLASLAFLAVSVPFVLWAFAMGGTPAVSVLVTLGLLALLLAVVCAIGLGFSALTARTAGSSVLTYVAVAGLTVVSLIVFGLSSALVTTTETVKVYQSDYTQETTDEDGNYIPGPCVWMEQEMPVTHTERIWWLLAINPFVVVADASPAPTLDQYGYPSTSSPLSLIQQGVRSARLGPPETQNWCWEEAEVLGGPVTTDTDAAALSPVWPWGLAANLLLGGLGVVVAVRRLRIPVRTLAKGTRIA